VLTPILVIFASAVSATSVFADDTQPVIVSVGVDQNTMTLQAYDPVVGEGLGEICFGPPIPGTPRSPAHNCRPPVECKPIPLGCTFTFAAPDDEAIDGELCVYVTSEDGSRQSECHVVGFPPRP
jgi:hypothetical protein